MEAERVESWMPINRQEAFDAMQAIQDPVLKNLVEFALETATAQFMKWDHLSREEFTRQLPQAPFDMLFFVRVMEKMFTNKERMLRLLEGRRDDDVVR